MPCWISLANLDVLRCLAADTSVRTNTAKFKLNALAERRS